jgi:outer membrane protein assembly factor BamB
MRTRWLFVMLLFGITGSVEGENWPHWRGPSAMGISLETGLPTRWSDTDNIAWKARLRGLGASTPIIWNDRVVVTSQIGGGVIRRDAPPLVQPGVNAVVERPLGGEAAPAVDTDRVSFLVTAFNHSDGRQLWEFELPSEGKLPSVHELHNLASSSPVTDGERIYAWFGTGQIVALDMNGKVVWKRHLGTDNSPFDILWGHSSSPIVYKDTIILVCYHNPATYLLALDRRTGEVRWNVPRGRRDSSYSTPLIINTPERVELVVNSGKGLSGHDASTGELLWNIDEDNQFPVPSPIFHNGVIYASRGYRSGPYMAIRPGGKGNIENSHLLWKIPTGAPYNSSLVYHEGLLYLVGDVGIITAVDAGTGRRVWQERVGGLFYSSPVIADGKVYMLSESGETIVVEASRPPRIIARNKLDGRFLASPVISGGRLFVRSDDTLIAIGK